MMANVPIGRSSLAPATRPGTLVATFVLVLAPTLSAQSGCRAPDDTSARIVHYVSFVLTDTSQASARARDSLGIATVQPSQIAPVTDSRACSKIVAFFDHFEGVTRRGRRVYAYSIGGRRFVAQDPNFKSGDWTPLMFLDQKYKLVQSHMVF